MIERQLEYTAIWKYAELERTIAKEKTTDTWQNIAELSKTINCTFFLIKMKIAHKFLAFPNVILYHIFSCEQSSCVIEMHIAKKMWDIITLAHSNPLDNNNRESIFQVFPLFAHIIGANSKINCFQYVLDVLTIAYKVVDERMHAISSNLDRVHNTSFSSFFYQNHGQRKMKWASNMCHHTSTD